jgi:hypothetical protein
MVLKICVSLFVNLILSKHISLGNPDNKYDPINYYYLWKGGIVSIKELYWV